MAALWVFTNDLPCIDCHLDTYLSTSSAGGLCAKTFHRFIFGRLHMFLKLCVCVMDMNLGIYAVVLAQAKRLVSDEAMKPPTNTTETALAY